MFNIYMDTIKKIDENTDLKCDICNMYDYNIHHFKYYNKKVCSNKKCIIKLASFPFDLKYDIK